MASTFTLAQLRDQAKDRADMANSSFVDDTHWNIYINSAWKELYNLLVTSYGDDYFATVGTPSTTDGVNTLFALPADFFKLLAVDQAVNGGNGAWVNVPPFAMQDRNRFSNFAGQIPPAGLVYRLTYIPRPVAMVNDGDSVDGIAGWEDYIVVRAAIKAMVKEESDPSALAAELASIRQNIIEMAPNRDAANPPTVVDAQAQMGISPGLGWSGYSYGYGADLGTVPSLRYRLSGSSIYLIGGPF